MGVLLYPDERNSEGSLDQIAGVSTETQCDVDAEDSAETIGTAQPVLSGTVRKTLKIHRRKVGHVETSAAENARRALQETGSIFYQSSDLLRLLYNGHAVAKD